MQLFDKYKKLYFNYVYRLINIYVRSNILVNQEMSLFDIDESDVAIWMENETKKKYRRIYIEIKHVKDVLRFPDRLIAEMVYQPDEPDIECVDRTWSEEYDYQNIGKHMCEYRANICEHVRIIENIAEQYDEELKQVYKTFDLLIVYIAHGECLGSKTIWYHIEPNTTVLDYEIDTKYPVTSMIQVPSNERDLYYSVYGYFMKRYSYMNAPQNFGSDKFEGIGIAYMSKSVIRIEKPIRKLIKT